MYQRRFDLIPNLVATVKGYAKHESDVFVQLAEARSKAGGVTNIDSSVTDDPEKLAYWQTRNVVFSSGNRSEEERLEAMKNGEMGLRLDAFIKSLPPMTEAERNRAIDEFVAEQRRLLDL